MDNSSPTPGTSSESPDQLLEGISQHCWIKSEIISSGKYFSVVSRDQNIFKCHCLICPGNKQTILSADASSCSNLKKHLKRRHPDVEKDFSAGLAKRQKLRSTASATSSSDARQTLLPFGRKPIAAINQKEFDKRIQAFIIDAMLPLSIVENEKFKNMFKDLTPGLQVLSRRSLGRHLQDKSSCVKGKISAEISQLMFVCTTADIWSTKHRSFMGVTVHWLDVDTLERRSGTLACKRFSGTHSYDRVAEQLDDIRRAFSIPEGKIIATVTDNGSNFVKAFKHFGVDFNMPSDDFLDELHPDLAAEILEDEIVEAINIEACDSVSTIILPSHKRCASHTLSLVCTTDAQKSITGAMSKIHHSAMGKCTALWNASGKPKSAEMIHSILKCHLRRPCPTRWNSLYDSVILLLNHKQKLNEVMTLLSLPVLKDAEVEYLEEYAMVMKPLAIALDRLQGDTNCHYGCLLPTLLAVHKKLDRLALHSLRYTRPLVDAVANGFKVRFQKFLNLDCDVNDAILATLSHPQFKDKWLTINENTNNEHHRKIMQNMLVSASKKEANSDVAESSVQQKSDADGTYSGSDDFFEYSSAPCDNRKDNACTLEMEVLKFLNDEKTSLSILNSYSSVKKVFLKYNTALPSSAPVERLFSYAGHIHAAKRGNLSDKMFEMLVLLKGNGSFI